MWVISFCVVRSDWTFRPYYQAQTNRVGHIVRPGRDCGGCPYNPKPYSTKEMVRNKPNKVLIMNKSIKAKAKPIDANHWYNFDVVF